MIADQNEMATLVAEKLYAKIKEDLITSGNGIINTVCTCIGVDVIVFSFLLSKTQTFFAGAKWNERAHRWG